MDNNYINRELLRVLKEVTKALKEDNDSGEYCGTAYLWIDDCFKAISNAEGSK